MESLVLKCRICWFALVSVGIQWFYAWQMLTNASGEKSRVVIKSSVAKSLQGN